MSTDFSPKHQGIKKNEMEHQEIHDYHDMSRWLQELDV
jgi:hypothetical protein